MLSTYFEKSKRVNPEETRLLLYYLLTDPANTKHEEYIINYVNDDADMTMSREYLVIRLVPKEKERKTSYRGFGIQSYHHRMRCIVQ